MIYILEVLYDEPMLCGAGCRQTTVQHQHQAGQPLCCYEKLPACHLIAPTSHADSIGLLRGAQGRLLRCRTHATLCPINTAID